MNKWMNEEKRLTHKIEHFLSKYKRHRDKWLFDVSVWEKGHIESIFNLHWFRSRERTDYMSCSMTLRAIATMENSLVAFHCTGLPSLYQSLFQGVRPASKIPFINLAKPSWSSKLASPKYKGISSIPHKPLPLLSITSSTPWNVDASSPCSFQMEITVRC